MRLLKIMFIIFTGELVFAAMTMTALAGGVRHAPSARGLHMEATFTQSAKNSVCPD